uniref:Uncharacterized protein n=1 Tax=Arundo donax TaxID=35708 RepID=A0A0A8YC69_ARUDO
MLRFLFIIFAGFLCVALPL